MDIDSEAAKIHAKSLKKPRGQERLKVILSEAEKLPADESSAVVALVFHAAELGLEASQEPRPIDWAMLALGGVLTVASGSFAVLVPDPSDFQGTVAAVVLALGGGFLTTSIPGVIEVDVVERDNLKVRATGGFGVFVLILWAMRKFVS